MESGNFNRFKGIEVRRAVTVARPADELYRYWRSLENLPKFISYLKRITILDHRRSHWVAKGPIGLKMEWNSELTDDIPNRLLGWRSIDGSDLKSMGAVEFTPSPDGQGTEVKVTVKYGPPAGRLGPWSPGSSAVIPRSRLPKASANSSK